MKKIFNILLKGLGVLLIVIVLLVVIVFAADRSQTSYLNFSGYPDAQPDSWLITHVNVLPMDRDTVLYDHDVLVKDGYIVDVASDIAESGVTVIDGEGGWLLPGLTDMHVHVWDKYELGLYLANGVTAVRNLWGRPYHLELKKQASEGEIISPMFFTSGPKLTGPEFMGDDNTQLFSEEEARKMVQEIHDKGYDLIKTYYGLPKNYFDVILEEAGKYHLDVAAHTSNKFDYEHHFQPRVRTVEHAEDIVQQALNYTLDTVGLKKMTGKFAQAEGTSFCPTLVVYYNIYRMLTEEHILKDESLAVMNPIIRKVDSKAQYDRWRQAKLDDPEVINRVKAQHEFHLKAVKNLHDAGVNIVCGSDAGIGITPAGYSIHRELEFYREAGLTPFEALQTATVNPAEVHDFLKETGTVETGKIANLLVVHADPLEHPETLEHPEWVMVQGHPLNRAVLDELEAEAAGRKNLLASLFRYVHYLWEK